MSRSLISKMAKLSSFKRRLTGFDGAGVINDVGSNVTGFNKGDHVVFQGWLDETTPAIHGTFQQYLVVPTHVIAKIPKSLPFEDAVTLFSCSGTIAVSLYSQKPGTNTLKLSPPWEEGGRNRYVGKSFFVPGGATNVGQFAIQFAKLSGFGPIITTASLRNTNLLKSYGATHVLDRTIPVEKIIEEVKMIAEGPVDLAYDAISEEETLSVSTAVLRNGGQLVVVLPGREDYFKKAAEEKGLQWAIAEGLLSLSHNVGSCAGLWEKFPELVEQGLIKPVPQEVLPGGLHAVAGGLERLRNNEISAKKLVVRLGETY